MGNGQSRIGRALGSLMVLWTLLLCPAPARAHKLYVFARLEGATIHGRAYFPGDVPAQHIDIIVHQREPSGRELGRTTTDDNGNFLFTARERVDHCLMAETIDGHTGQYTVRVAALPDSLPADVPAEGGGSLVASQTAHSPPAPLALAAKENEPASVKDQLEQLGRQLDDLREQVYKSDASLRFRDILGGIGFILGLAGIAFYMKARKRT